MRRPEQTGALWKKNSVRKLSRPGSLVMDFCSGTCCTAKACMLVDQRGAFVGSFVDSELPTAAERDHSMTFVTHMLDPESDSGGSEKAQAAPKVFKDEIAALLASKKASLQEAPPGLDGTQEWLGHTLHLITATYADYLLYDMCRQLLLNKCLLVWRSRFYSTELKAFLAPRGGQLRIVYSKFHDVSREDL